MSANILIIEDDNDFAQALKIKIEETIQHANVVIKEFTSGLEELTKLDPDVVILDVFKGEPQYDMREGLKVRDAIWRTLFVPLVFASASRPDAVVEMAKNHPLVRFVFKGESGAIGKIAGHVPRFSKYGAGIKKIRRTLYSAAETTTQKALTDTAPHILNDSVEPEKGLSLLESTARRRLAALTRLEAEENHEEIFSWEQYIYPPVADHLLTGDILRAATGPIDKPTSFCVVLTPSCDLANQKVKNILVAHCVSMQDYWTSCSLPYKNNDKNIKRISANLNDAQSSGYKPLPKYSDLIPHMAISLRELELLTISEGAKAKSADGVEYARVVSLDSPFREQLLWAYLEIAGRPGLPNRDMKTWIGDILNHLAELGGQADD